MRVMQWQTIPSIIDTQNKTAIEEIRIELDQIKQRLAVLNERQQKLDEIIEQGKQLKANKDNDVNHLNVNSERTIVFFCLENRCE